MQLPLEQAQLEGSIHRYRAALNAIEDAIKDPKTAPSSEQFLELLTARQALQVELNNTSPTFRKSLLRDTKQLDDRLRKQIDSIQRSTQLANWRSNLNPPLEAWSWFFESSLHRPWWDYNPIWSFLSLVCLTASVSLIVDISSRLWSGGLDALGTFAIIVQSLVALLAGGTALSKLGLGGLFKPIEQLLTYCRISRKFWHELSFCLSLVFLIFLWNCHQSLPTLSNKYNDSGEIDYANGQLRSAEDKYNRALKLDPNNEKAHYNLGIFYEYLQEPAPAIEQYQLAIKGNYYKAFNNLARLYTRDSNYTQAVPWLLKGLKKPKNEEDKKIQSTVIDKLIDKLAQLYISDKKLFELEKSKNEENEKIEYYVIDKLARLYIKDKKYSEFFSLLNAASDSVKGESKRKHIIHQSWGWALLEQGDYFTAEDKLRTAIELEQDLGLSKTEGFFPHCLLAQVLEKKDSKKEALKEWEHCVQYGNILDLDKAKWVELAQQRWKELKAKGY